MHKIIENLMNETDQWCDENKEYGFDSWVEKFSESLILECAASAGWSQGHAQRHILEHFGISLNNGK